jgi:uncharacterized phage protein (TIGR01671 family)
MRDTEFRGKSIYTGELVYGDLIHVITGHPMIEVRAGSHDGEDILVDPETVGEYTGLKDKNGVKIFEGDIARLFFEPCDGQDYSMARTGVITYLPEVMSFVLGAMREEGCASFIGRDSRSIEVISNIHDTPELIKEK